MQQNYLYSDLIYIGAISNQPTVIDYLLSLELTPNQTTVDLATINNFSQGETIYQQ
jgi:hypothetical protein